MKHTRLVPQSLDRGPRLDNGWTWSVVGEGTGLSPHKGVVSTSDHRICYHCWDQSHLVAMFNPDRHPSPLHHQLSGMLENVFYYHLPSLHLFWYNDRWIGLVVLVVCCIALVLFKGYHSHEHWIFTVTTRIVVPSSDQTCSANIPS